MTLDLPETGERAFGNARTLPRVHTHNGVDLRGKEGAPVYAAAPGLVLYATREWRSGFSGYGRVVVVDHGDGTYALYAHLRECTVHMGERVRAGDRVGSVGRTRYTRENPTALFATSGAHLHFEVSPRKYPQSADLPRLDPVAWLRANRLRLHPIARLSVVDSEAPPKPSPPPPPSGGVGPVAALAVGWMWLLRAWSFT